MGRQRFEFLRGIPDAVVVTDAAGQIVFCNRAAEALLAAPSAGPTMAELVGAPLETIRRLVERDGSWRGEVQLGPEPGRGGCLDWSISACELEDGRSGFLAIGRRALPERRETGPTDGRLRLVLQHTSDIIQVIDQRGVSSYVSDQIIQVLGYRPEELLGASAFAGIHPDDLPRVMEVFVEGLTQPGAVRKAEYRYRRKDGSWIDLEAVGCNRLDDHAVNGIVLSIRDVSERKRVERALRGSELRFRSIAEQTTDLIALTDEQGLVTYASPASLSLFQLTPPEMCGRHFAELFEESSVPAAMSAFRNAAASGSRVNNLELRLRRKDGSVFSGELNAADFRIDDQPSSLIVIRDVTERERVRERQERSEAMLSAAISQSPAGILIADAPDVRIRVANPAAFAIRGRADALTEIEVAEHSRRWNTFLPDGTTPYPSEQLPLSRAVLEGVVSCNVEAVIRNERGENRWVSANAGPIRDRDGTIVSGIVVFHDITEQKLAEQALQESEQRYKLLHESAGVGIGYYTPDGTVISYNRLAAAHMGGQPEEYVGKSMAELFPPAAVDEYRRRLERACLSDRPQEYEDLVDLPSGQMWFLTVVNRIEDARGKIVGVQFISSDLTERKRMEDALRLSERTLAEAQRQIQLGSFTFDFRTGRLHWSEEMLRIFGVRPDQFGGTPRDFLDRVHPEDLARVEADRGDSSSRPGPHELELRIVRPDGVERSIRLVFETVFDDHGAPLRWLGTSQDITEAKKAAVERSRLEAQLLQAMKMEAVGRLAGGVAHDFNNLLTAIICSVQFGLTARPAHDVMVELLQDIGQAADSAAALTRQLLAFSRKQLIEPRVVDLNELITAMHKMLGRLIGEDIELRTLPGEQLGAVRVDPGQLEQILVNLAVNARDAMPDGGRLLIETRNVALDDEYCQLHRHAHPGPQVMLAVSDGGCGMSAEVKAHIFEPFFTTKERGKGTGLGLAMIYGAVKQADGSIEVYSELGRGTTFKIYLPRVDEATERLGQDGGAAEMPGGSETVLVAEDEPMVRSLAIKILRRLGYTVLDAASGEDALILAQEHTAPIQLLLTDVVMPGMNGRQLAECLERLHPETRVLYSSGYTDNAIAHHGVLDPGLSFLGKPYTPQVLARKVREVLDR